MNDESTYIVDWFTMLMTGVAMTPVRTRSFEIDGTNDPKRGIKQWTKGKLPKTREGFSVYGMFDGMDPGDMPS